MSRKQKKIQSFEKLQKSNRLKITIEYDGGDFHGWQRQPNLRTVQGEITQVLTRLAGKEVLIEGSGRTDGGVHAMGQVATFDWDGPVPTNRLKRVLNHHLPQDIFIKSLEEVDCDFHARFSAVGKCYTYKLYKSQKRSPLQRRYAYRVCDTIGIENMKKASQKLLGTHDFKAFMASGSYVKDTVRTIYHIDFEEKGQFIYIRFYGNGFLYNMVRILTGLLVDVGMGKKEESSVSQIIRGKDRTQVEHTAPAEGLFLSEVYYSQLELEKALAEKRL